MARGPRLAPGLGPGHIAVDNDIYIYIYIYIYLYIMAKLLDGFRVQGQGPGYRQGRLLLQDLWNIDIYIYIYNIYIMDRFTGESRG